ncbi:hypothetical protein WJX74_010126 [Apatococcus lobatus]|uniref:Ubiquitin thioesterase OTU n=1 Tax=Apatococcus lobatus TaxID=904363 RepID=A0AAW1QW72_9CHLO
MGFASSFLSCPCTEPSQATSLGDFSLWQPYSAPAFASASIVSRSTARPLVSLAEATLSGVKGKNWRLYKVKPDGKCMFRALAQGLARHKGDFLATNSEEIEADQLKLAVSDILCENPARRNEFKDATYNVEHGGTGDASFTAYCRRIKSEGFWGGAAELSALSQLLKVPITVYQPESTVGYEPIVVYGQQWTMSRAGGKSRRMINLLYSSGNHYDLLV